MSNKFKNIDWTRMMFLVPIILVAGISISHVVTWYNMTNPYAWSIYLSLAIEVGAMTSLVAATKKIKGGVWFMFGLVTLIQIIGNIFYSYSHINETGELFKQWVELTGPIFELMGTETTDVIVHKRWLSFIEGGLLPLISLTSLHFFVKYENTEKDVVTEVKVEQPKVEPEVIEEPKIETKNIWNKVNELRDEGKLPTPTQEDMLEEPTALAFTPYETEEYDDIEEEPISGSSKSIYNNVLDVEAKPEPDPEELEHIDELIPEEERQRHLKFRKRLLDQKLETEEPSTTVEISNDGRTATIQKRDKITQKLKK